MSDEDFDFFLRNFHTFRLGRFLVSDDPTFVSKFSSSRLSGLQIFADSDATDEGNTAAIDGDGDGDW